MIAKEIIRERTSPRWETKFGQWVRKYGVLTLAKALDITPHAVFHWIRSSHFPRPDYVRKTIALADGELTIADIYAHSEAMEAIYGTTPPLPKHGDDRQLYLFFDGGKK